MIATSTGAATTNSDCGRIVIAAPTMRAPLEFPFMNSSIDYGQTDALTGYERFWQRREWR